MLLLLLLLAMLLPCLLAGNELSYAFASFRCKNSSSILMKQNFTHYSRIKAANCINSSIIDMQKYMITSQQTV